MSIIHQIGLTFIPNVGHITAKHLLGHFGSAEAVFKASKKDLLCIPGIGEMTAADILGSRALFHAEEQLKFIERHQVDVLFFGDDRYPRRLMECCDAPMLLYYKGSVDLNHRRVVSIVGTRMATAYGKELCRQLAETLAPYDVMIVSGLAYGIDISSHRESLKRGVPTVGVLAHGLDRIYPATHGQTAKDMVLNGGLLTEFPLNTRPDRENFPKRNRIIAGISDVTIVVEAALKGGALITAELANSYNRDVYAFPGRTNDLYSEGCNFLIKTNRAGLISHPRDLIYYLGWSEVKPLPMVSQASLPLGLSPEEVKVLEVLKQAPALIDELAVRSGLPQSKLAICLLSLEMQGIITVFPGKLYKLN